MVSSALFENRIKCPNLGNKYSDHHEVLLPCVVDEIFIRVPIFQETSPTLSRLSLIYIEKQEHMLSTTT